jgi:hypothetical protein
MAIPPYGDFGFKKGSAVGRESLALEFRGLLDTIAFS